MRLALRDTRHLEYMAPSSLEVNRFVYHNRNKYAGVRLKQPIFLKSAHLKVAAAPFGI